MNQESRDNEWKIILRKTASKQLKKLPENIRLLFNLLMRDLEEAGPIRKNWSNFSSLNGHGLPRNAYHCHIKKGRPTYVVCWYVVDKNLKIIEVFYVGSHENAPY